MQTEDDVAGFDGAICRGARAMLGMSQQELCDAAGCGRKLLNDFENGLVTPKVSKRSEMMAALEAAGTSFVRLDGMMAVGVRPGAAGARSARGKAFVAPQ